MTKIELQGRLGPVAPAFGSVVAVLVLAANAGAATFYVAPPPQGSDSNPGTLGSPWATLQMAADTIQPGDTVLVRAGQYVGAHFTTSGTESLPITVRAYDDELVEIVEDNASTPDGLNLEGASWMTVEGFTITGRGRAGIRAVLCDHVALRRNRLDANQKWGILTGFCDDLLIEDNECSRSVVEHGIYVSNSGDRPTIRRNLIWGNHANGIHMNGDASLGGDGVISGALVEANEIFGNGTGGGSGINMDGVQDSVIRNNLVYAHHSSGISLYRIDGGEPSSGNQILHNTVIVASDGRWGLNIRDSSTGNTVLNNVFYSDHDYRGAMSVATDSLTGLISDFNAVEDRFTIDDGDTVMTLAEWQGLTGLDGASLVATPTELFEAPGAGDFELRRGSPAEDAGLTLATVLIDRHGRQRPIGIEVDIGAHEGVEVLFADGYEDGLDDRWSVVMP